MARDVGYDGVEVMVWTDPVSQDVNQIAKLSDRFDMPVLAIHAPCLLITQRVWSTDPWERLRRSLEAAEKLGAGTVVVHPPFRWQRDYARDFVEGVAQLEAESGIDIAVENMYPWRAGKRELPAYAPHWDPTDQAYAHNTLDLSHTAVSGTDVASAFPSKNPPGTRRARQARPLTGPYRSGGQGATFAEATRARRGKRVHEHPPGTRWTLTPHPSAEPASGPKARTR
jgi:hypothetical protein